MLKGGFPLQSRWMKSVLIVVASGLAGITALGQQDSGSATPRRPTAVQPLLDSGGRIREDVFVPGPSLQDTDQVYGDITGARMKTMVNDVVTISRRSRDDGNRYWGRIAGTKYEAMTGDLIEAKFKSLGLVDIHRKEFDLAPQWFPLDWHLSATGAGKTQTFKTLL